MQPLPPDVSGPNRSTRGQAFRASRERILVTAMLAGALAACSDSAWRHTEVLESSTTNAALAGTDDPAIVAPDAVTTPALGAKDPLVVVTIFSDFQCPACTQLPDLLDPILLQYGSVIQIQYRQFPLEAMHPRAKIAAIAALAAHRQGHYKCFGTELYRSQDAWTDSNLVDSQVEAHFTAVATACGLDLARFAADRKDPRLDEKVERDVELARDLEIRGTPTVLIDGLEMERRWKAGIYQALRPNAIIQRGIRDSEQLLKQGGELRAVRAMRIEGNMGDGEKAARLLD